jgi:hypothetical protein
MDAYHLAFTFDADVGCLLRVHLFAEERIDKNGNLT